MAAASTELSMSSAIAPNTQAECRSAIDTRSEYLNAGLSNRSMARCSRVVSGVSGEAGGVVRSSEPK